MAEKFVIPTVLAVLVLVGVAGMYSVFNGALTGSAVKTTYSSCECHYQVYDDADRVVGTGSTKLQVQLKKDETCDDACNKYYGYPSGKMTIRGTPSLTIKKG